jgi:hypothetical protein
MGDQLIKASLLETGEAWKLCKVIERMEDKLRSAFG